MSRTYPRGCRRGGAAEAEWARTAKLIRISFWGLNGGLALMVLSNLFPGGVLQLIDVLNNGYWHARGTEFLGGKLMRTIEWLRLPGDLVFIAPGVVPMLIAGILVLKLLMKSRSGERTD